MEKNIRTFMPKEKVVLFKGDMVKKLIDDRKLVLDLCKKTCNNWGELDKSKKQVRMYNKCKEMGLDWNCIFIHEYINKGMAE